MSTCKHAHKLRYCETVICLKEHCLPEEPDVFATDRELEEYEKWIKYLTCKEKCKDYFKNLKENNQ